MVEEIQKQEFKCERCNRIYQTKQDAIDCEKRDSQEKQLDNITEFEIKQEHLKLLKEMYVDWDDCEFGAPAINPKRPYGNSSGVDDVAEILGIKKTKDNVEDYDKEEASEYSDKEEYLEDLEWNTETYEYLMRIHKEMRIVLQIVLKTQSFKLGKYRRKDSYGIEWISI